MQTVKFISNRKVTTIKNFKEIRRDGKVIDESMKATDIFALGHPEKVIEVQWKNDSQSVSIRDAYGVPSTLRPPRFKTVKAFF